MVTIREDIPSSYPKSKADSGAVFSTRVHQFWQELSDLPPSRGQSCVTLNGYPREKTPDVTPLAINVICFLDSVQPAALSVLTRT